MESQDHCIIPLLVGVWLYLTLFPCTWAAPCEHCNVIPVDTLVCIVCCCTYVVCLLFFMRMQYLMDPPGERAWNARLHNFVKAQGQHLIQGNNSNSDCKHDVLSNKDNTTIQFMQHALCGPRE